MASRTKPLMPPLALHRIAREMQERSERRSDGLIDGPSSEHWLSTDAPDAVGTALRSLYPAEREHARRWAESLTTTNCWWATYRLGQVVLSELAPYPPSPNSGPQSRRAPVTAPEVVARAVAQGMTQAAVARQFGISRQRVFQIIQRQSPAE